MALATPRNVLDRYHDYEWLVPVMAAPYAGTYHDDALQYARIGLWRAARTWKPDGGRVFDGWARLCIKWEIQDGLRELDPLSRSQRAKVREYWRTVNRLSQEQGAWPSRAQLADEGVSDDVFQMIEVLTAAHLEPWAWDRVTDHSNPADIVTARDSESRLLRLISRLPTPHSIVMDLYYWEDLTLKEVGAVLGVGESRISQLRKQAVAWLRGED